MAGPTMADKGIVTVGGVAGVTKPAPQFRGLYTHHIQISAFGHESIVAFSQRRAYEDCGIAILKKVPWASSPFTDWPVVWAFASPNKTSL